GTCSLERVMSQRIRVRIRPPSGSGRLRARYDTEANVLEVSSGARRPWPFGVDIDGRVIFDLDRDRILAYFDLLIPRRLWKIEAALSPPPNARAGDLQFSQEATEIKSFHIPISVASGSGRECARIQFGENTF